MDRETRANDVFALGRDQGFALTGISAAQPSEHAQYVRRWIGEGYHGQMQYLADNLDVRLDPRRLLEGARSVICLADRYPSDPPPGRPASSGPVSASPVAQSTNPDQPAPAPLTAPAPVGQVARYAWGDDYHKIIKKRLHAMADTLAGRFPDHAFRCVVDTAPVMEREHAARAGLGWIGKHTLMLHPYHGSWFLLGNIVTTLDLATSEELDFPDQSVPPADHCGTCTRCIDACPTDAIAIEGYQLDARRCISYLTLEHRGEIDPQFHAEMGPWIAGCDICQQVCPYNGPTTGRPARQGRPASAGPIPNARPQRGRPDAEGPGQQNAKPTALPIHPHYQPRNQTFDLNAILDWTEQDRREAFQRSALKRMKLDMVKRNALIAAANALADQDNPAPRALGRRIEQLADDWEESELVRRTAQQVMTTLRLRREGIDDSVV